MITKQEIYEGLFGAWRLLLRDRGAVALFDDSVSGFWKSFVGAALIFPIYAALLLLGIDSQPNNQMTERPIVAISFNTDVSISNCI